MLVDSLCELSEWLGVSDFDFDFDIDPDFVVVLVCDVDFVLERVVVEVLVLLVYVAGVCRRRAVSVSGPSGSNVRSSFKVCGQLDVSDALS